jgi:hypothetical protein
MFVAASSRMERSSNALRGYVQLSLFQAIIDARSSFVCRLGNIVWEILEERPDIPRARSGQHTQPARCPRIPRFRSAEHSQPAR